MSGETGYGGVVGGLERVVVGGDGRLRATWRVLLAAPLIMLVAAVTGLVAPPLGGGMFVGGVVQAAVFGVLLVGWARYVDRRPVREYGLDVSGSWVADLGAAFAAVLLAHGVWYAVAGALGWVSVAPSAWDGAVAVALAGAFGGIALNVWVQDTVYFGLVLRSGAEGLHARGLTARRAVLGGLVVSTLFFMNIHGGTLERLFDYAFTGTIYGLLYVHTGDLSLPVGFHFGLNFSGGWLFPAAAVAGGRPAAFAVTETLPLLQGLPRVPQIALAYLLVAGWLYWRRGELGVAESVARWRG